MLSIIKHINEVSIISNKMENKIYQTSLTNSNNNDEDIISSLNNLPEKNPSNIIPSDNNTLTDQNIQTNFNLHRFGHSMNLSIIINN